MSQTQSHHQDLQDRASVIPADPWISLRKFTSARIALGRAGGSLPTSELLKFSLDHAAARDAVNSELDWDRLQTEIEPLGIPVLKLQSRTLDRRQYLQRPDLGRLLSLESEALLKSHQPAVAQDISIVVADGLSALATQLHAASVLKELVPSLKSRGLKIAPIALVRLARVAVTDAIGSILNAAVGLILIGERPGLGSADSLGAYLTFRPRPGNTDANRNCVSNIRPDGLPPGQAAQTLLYLIDQILAKQISGVEIKDERTTRQQLI
jgi:ethanolamine ammonia-lyase small subunit